MNRRRALLSHGEMAHDVLDDHDAGIQDRSDGQRHTAQGHDVHGVAREIEAEHADDDRQRNDEQHTEGGFELPQEEDHDE